MTQLQKSKLPYSLLDLCPITLGSTAADSFKNSAELAKHAENLGFKRFWVAEHHNIPSVASSATSIVIAHIASQTKSIRVGSGGIMLSNHAPLTIAEQFGTLESLFPGRIDLGLGRAPGGDRSVMRALRRNLTSGADAFDVELAELRSYFKGSDSGAKAVPGMGLDLPIYLLGSSDYSARLAAREGLPFAFASHFAPDYIMEALQIYRSTFKPSKTLSKPHVILGVNIFAAKDDYDARILFTTVQQSFLNMLRGVSTQVLPPLENMNGVWNELEAAHVSKMLKYSAVGSPEKVLDQLQEIVNYTSADELIFTSHMYEQSARLKSFEIAAEVMKKIE